jgi:hypothetical protein
MMLAHDLTARRITLVERLMKQDPSRTITGRSR